MLKWRLFDRNITKAPAQESLGYVEPAVDQTVGPYSTGAHKYGHQTAHDSIPVGELKPASAILVCGD